MLKRKILIPVRLPTQFVAMIRIYHDLKNEFEFNFVFEDYANNKKDIQYCENNKIKFYTELAYSNPSTKKDNVIFQVLHIEESRFISLLHQLNLLLKKIKFYKYYLKLVKPDFIFFAEHGYFQFILAELSRRMKIPSFIFPFSLWNHEEYAFSKKNMRIDKSAISLKQFISIKLFSENYYELENSFTPYLTLSEYLSFKLLGLHHPLWKIFNLKASKLMFESPFFNDYYIFLKLPTQNYHIVGSPTLDYIKLNKFTPRQSRINILISLPPFDALKFEYTLSNEFNDFNDFLDKFSSYLKKVENPNLNIIYKFHPKFSFNEISGYQRRFNISVSNLDTPELIIQSDLYIAFASATIRWALAKGIPVINYDIARSNYNDYKQFEQVIKCENFNDFKLKYAKMTQIREFYLEMKNKSEKQSAYFESKVSFLENIRKVLSKY